MVDELKSEADDATAESTAGVTPTVPPSAGVSVTPATEPTSPSVRVEGLAETLSRVRHELQKDQKDQGVTKTKRSRRSRGQTR